MTRAEVEQRVIEVVKAMPTIAGCLPHVDYSLKTKLIEELGFDSLDIAEVQMELEDQFEKEVKFEFPSDALTGTVGDFVDAIMAEMRKKQ